MLRLLRKRGPYEGVVCRADHPRHGWGWYAVKHTKKGDKPDLGKPVRHADGGWEYA
jgi:hypothetical protein